MAIWDTSTLPEAEQFEYYHQVICRAFVPLRPIAVEDSRGFASKVETRPLGALNRASVASRTQATHHGPIEVSTTAAPYYFVNLQLRGRCHVRQGSTESIVAPGQFTVVDTAEPFYLDFDQDWRMLSFRLPHDLLAGRLIGGRPRMGAAVAGVGVGAAASSLMRTLWDLNDDVPGYIEGDLAQAFATVVGSALSLSAVDDQVDAPDTSRAIVLAYLADRLADPTLSVQSVSRALAISPRRLHSLFEGTDATFAAALRRMRMDRASQLLADSRLSITDVGVAVGYPDPSGFARTFRRISGMPPTAFRREHESPDAAARIA